jgi:hypothetical protein
MLNYNDNLPAVYNMPSDIETLFATLCQDRDELPVRMYRSRVGLLTGAIEFAGLLRYDQHIAALFLIEVGHHRQEAMDLADRGVYRAHLGNLDTLRLQRGAALAKVAGSVALTNATWTVLRRKDTVVPINSSLGYSALAYDVRSGRVEPLS